MDFKDVVMQRYACRPFTSETIPESKIDELLELIRWTASGLNLQTWRIRVVRDPATRQAIAEAAWGQQQVANCSHLLVLCAVHDVLGQTEKLQKALMASGLSEAESAQRVGYAKKMCAQMPPPALVKFADQQVFLALGNAINGAKSLGLDSCPMTGFDAAKVAALLGLPEGIVPTALCPLGYGAGGPTPRMRFAAEDILI